MKITLLLALLLAPPLFAQDWELNPDTTFPEEFYMQDTVLIKPTEYPGLPKHIGVFLEKEKNAMIPQVSAKIRPDLPRPHNVLRGNFDGNGIDDWVVMFCDEYCENAGHVLFLDGKITKYKYRNSDEEYIKYVQNYDGLFDNTGNIYSYLVEIPADSLNNYKYDFEMMGKKFRQWVETAMPFEHSGFKERYYDDYTNSYEYYFYYYNAGEVNSLVHDIE